jgi:hypothetical protein
LKSFKLYLFFKSKRIRESGEPFQADFPKNEDDAELVIVKIHLVMLYRKQKVIVAPRGNPFIATGGSDGQVRLWQKEKKRMTFGETNFGSVHDIDFHLEENLVIIPRGNSL